MDSMSESLDMNKWKEVDASQKAEGYKEYQVLRQHKQTSPNSYQYMIQPSPEEEAVKVVIEFTHKDKDPLKSIGTVELLLKGDKITGIDLDGDCYQLQ